MSDVVRKVDYFTTKVPNRAGQAAKILSGLSAAGVDLIAFTGFPSGKGSQLDLVPADSSKLKRAAKKLGVTLSGEQVARARTLDELLAQLGDTLRP